ncbi:DUF2635 domain-containing protein [Salmonella enterica]|nr:DUF2635 domain-containing protein [Salmonella enterica]EJF9115662.1 DUF2635 domain-containing protein [Salmonella enterica]
MDKLYIKPAPGRAVRDPVTQQLLAADGEQKPRTPFWLRRLADGDVVVVTHGSGETPPGTAAEPAPKKTRKNSEAEQ